MKKLILSMFFAVAILSACEKIVLKAPSADPIRVSTISDTAAIKPTTPAPTLAPATTPATTPATVPVVVLSFSKDVIPVLNMCENCHSHGWAPSSVAATYYTNLVNRGYVKPAAYTASTIYSKLSSGHPGSGSISTVNTDKIINWMKTGSLNN